MDGRSVASSALSESQCESTAFSSSVDALASLPAVAAALTAGSVGSSSLSDESERRRRWIGEVGVLRFVGRKVAISKRVGSAASAVASTAASCRAMLSETKSFSVGTERLRQSK